MSQKYEMEMEMARLPEDVRNFLSKVMINDSEAKVSVFSDGQSVDGFQVNDDLSEEEDKELEKLKEKYV